MNHPFSHFESPPLLHLQPLFKLVIMENCYNGSTNKLLQSKRLKLTAWTMRHLCTCRTGKVDIFEFYNGHGKYIIAQTQAIEFVKVWSITKERLEFLWIFPAYILNGWRQGGHGILSVSLDCVPTHHVWRLQVLYTIHRTQLYRKTQIIHHLKTVHGTHGYYSSFKIYFTTIFSTINFQFSAINNIQTDP